jgi:hypothetical protein
MATVNHGAAVGERRRDDPPARGRRRCNQARHSQFPADRDCNLLENGWTLKRAAAMEKHASTRTTRHYDRRRAELDEVERIVIWVWGSIWRRVRNRGALSGLFCATKSRRNSELFFQKC